MSIGWPWKARGVETMSERERERREREEREKTNYHAASAISAGRWLWSDRRNTNDSHSCKNGK